MAVLSLRVSDALKKSLESEAKKENISLSEYVKNKLLDDHILNTEQDSKVQIKQLEISNDVTNDTMLLKKMYWILISVSILLGIISIPILLFSISFISGY